MNQAEAEADAFLRETVEKRKRLMVSITHPSYQLTDEDRQILAGALRYLLAHAEWAK